MAGRVISIIPKTVFNFNVGANGSVSQTIGPRAIATPDWVSGTLMVRVYDSSFGAGLTEPELTVAVLNVQISPEDPNTIFIQGEDGNDQLASVSIDHDTPTGATPGSLLTKPLGTSTVNIGSMIAVGLNLSQGTTAGSVSVTIGVDLVGRDQ